MPNDITVMPWDCEPTLDKATVDLVMQKLMKACFELKDSINSKYDDAWTIGTKKYGWALNVIQRMALSGKYPAITIGKSGLGQVFKINSVPIAIVTDDLNNPKKLRRYMPSELEDRQIPLFQEPPLPKALVWRVILDMKISNNNGNELDSTPQIKLVGFDGTEVAASYTYDDIFVPVLTQLNQEDPKSVRVVESLVEESKAKPVKLVRRVRKNEDKESKGQ